MAEVQTHTVFDLATRLPVSCITCTPGALADHVRDGQVAIAGDHRNSRLNAANNPEHDHERADAAIAERIRNARLAQIQELESKQHRRVRELLAATDPKMKAYEEEAAALRALL